MSMNYTDTSICRVAEECTIIAYASRHPSLKNFLKPK